VIENHLVVHIQGRENCQCY